MSKETNTEDKKKYTDQVKEIRSKLRKLRFDNALSQLDDTSQIRKQKKELARVLTKLSSLK